MPTRKRLLEISNDLDITAKLFKRTKSKMRRQAINQLRYLLIREQNQYNNYGKDDWREL